MRSRLFLLAALAVAGAAHAQRFDALGAGDADALETVYGDFADDADPTGDDARASTEVLDREPLDAGEALGARGSVEGWGSAGWRSDPGDVDGDGIEAGDNCPFAANPDQLDTDGDGAGDVCDPCPYSAPDDSDDDGVCDAVDNCPGAPNPDQANADGDAFGDACDACGKFTLECQPGGGCVDYDYYTLDDEDHLYVVADDCPGCAAVCPDRPHATSLCTPDGCDLQCAKGWLDCDGLAENGCEQPVVGDGVDLPDDAGVDSDCDGIDGSIADAVFVSPDGDDLNPGTIDLPLATLGAAIAVAAPDNTTSARDVYVADGAYTEPATLELVPGVNVYGGYDPITWARDPVNLRPVVTVLAPVAVRAEALAATTIIDSVEFRGGDAQAPGESAYGLFAREATDLVLRHSRFVAGDGAPGADGAGLVDDGKPILGGSDGAAGQPGCEDSVGPFCASCDLPTGGAGGAPPLLCGARTGGNGGAGGQAGHGTASGQPGQPGACGSGASCAPGAGGVGVAACGGTNWCMAATDEAGSDGADGQPGADGAAAAPGAFGPQGFQATQAAPGTPGEGGAGGGGGGGGGGGDNECDSFGAAGGGGGSGGCGGLPGAGGRSGGASIGVYAFHSALTLYDVEMVGGDGGAGGDGVAGTPGGEGGSGAAFGPNGCWGGPFGHTGDQDDGTMGAPGGDGGDGGRGGHGGGGRGGPSYGLVSVDTPDATLSADPYEQWLALTLSASRAYGGRAGVGGASAGQPGSAGANGGFLYVQGRARAR